MRLAFVSPVPPSRSGISYYSAELLPALARHYDIDVIVDRRSDKPAGASAVKSARWFDRNAHLYDRIVYQFGNSMFHAYMFGLLDRHPGVVVLHDVFLTGVLAEMNVKAAHRGIWNRELLSFHGYGALRDKARDHESTVLRYPSCGGVIAASTAVIMHSQSAIEMAAKWYGREAAQRSTLIPHLRAASAPADREAARARLKLRKDDFVVCSFGNIARAKLSDRLVDAWLASSLAHDPRCRLILAGRLAGGREFDREMTAKARSAPAANVSVTGWLDDTAYQDWLIACDAAVQLRTSSRGESSGAALDCLGRGVPLMVNAHGSMAELPGDAVIMLDEDFPDADLVTCLELLRDDPARRSLMSSRGLGHVRDHHDPARVAELYRDAIESVAKQPPRPLPRKRQLLVDLSAIARHDLRTGVERVARSLLGQFVDAPPAGYNVEAVYAEDGGGFRYARRYMEDLLGLGRTHLGDHPVEMRAGDIYFMPDLHHMRVIENAETYRAMRANGVSVNIMVHDLLPIQFPQFFPPAARETHARWLRVVAEADRAICVSQAVADDLRSWFRADGISPHASIEVSRHGSDPLASESSRWLDTGDEALLLELERTHSFLMVGTVEPRKGHAQVLDAFETLWRQGGGEKLVIVGKAGWMVDDLTRRLRHHPERGKRLLWLEKASDDLLDRLYGACSCLIAASYGEGFGLPLIEAAMHGLPIIARDIPVFREVAQDHATYFKAETGAELSVVLKDWVALAERGDAPQSRDMPHLTWAQSAENLKRILLGG